jgi:ribokinase
MRVQRIPLAGETVLGWDFHTPMDGGKGSNQAIAAARLDAGTAFVGCVGRDRLGDECEQWLQQAGVDTRCLFRSDTMATGAGFILLDAAGVPAMVTAPGANDDLSAEAVDQALEKLAGARVLLTQFEIQPAVALHAARRARERGMLAIVNPAPAAQGPLAGWERSDILVPNEMEARALLGWPLDRPHAGEVLAQAVREHTGVARVLVTLGEAGVAGVEPDGAWHIPARAVAAVDTSGAGDVFCAALAAGLVSGATLRGAAEWACAAATVSVTRPGTIPSFPRRAEVERFIQN